MMEPIQYGLGALSGGLVGLLLATFGGGGSIIAVPLMIYVVGVPQPHMAIGTSALAVAVNAATGLVGHAQAGTVKWRCAGFFSVAGVTGAFCGSSLGKLVDGDRLLGLFAVMMLVVGLLMLRSRNAAGVPGAQCNRDNIAAVLVSGLCVGGLSGFFGIGGGFLIVPALMAATRMPILNAVGSSLVAVTAFGLTTAANYTVSGLIDWPLAAAFIGGGLFGGIAGRRVARRLSARGGLLNTVFASLICVVAVYMLLTSLGVFRAE